MVSTAHALEQQLEQLLVVEDADGARVVVLVLEQFLAVGAACLAVEQEERAPPFRQRPYHELLVAANWLEDGTTARVEPTFTVDRIFDVAHDLEELQDPRRAVRRAKARGESPDDLVTHV